MRVHPRFSLLFALLLASPLAAQQAFTYGQDVILPRFGPQGADHATVATNSFGDAFVAYHSTFASGYHLVEGMAIQHQGGGQFQTGTGNHFALGNQGLAIFGQDSCIKPDVVAMPDGNFVVAWSRLDKTEQQLDRIEMCRIVMRDANGNLLPTAVVESAQAGEGFVIDPAFDGHDSGGMVDLVNLEDGTVAAVYAHQTSNSSDAQGNTWRDYDLRLTRVDWTVDPSDPNFISPPVVLQSNVPFDNPWNQVPRGGQVLPDVVLDDYGNLVVAHEEFWMDGHGGVSGSNLGRIVVRRVSGFGSAAPLTEINFAEFTHDPLRAQRRPNLSTSRSDSRNSVSLTWGHDDVWFLTDLILSQELIFNGTSLTTRNLYWPNSPLFTDDLPTIVHGANSLRATIGTRQVSGGSILLAGRALQQDTVTIPTTVNYALRPAAALRELVLPHGTYQALYTTYEGADVNDPHQFDVHLVIHRVP